MARHFRYGNILAAVCLTPFSAQAEGFAQLKEVRFWNSGDTSRIAIETDTEVRFEYDRLQDPDRIYVDLRSTRPSKGRQYFTIPVTEGPLKQIRVALKSPTVTRVVLDLSEDVEYTVSQLAVPDRVVIELKQKGAPAPAPAPATAEPTAAPVPPPVEVTQAPPRQFRAPKLEPVPVPSSRRDLLASQDVPRVTAREHHVQTPDVLMASVATRPKRLRRELPPVAPPPAPPPVAETVTVPETPPADEKALKSLTRILGLKLNRVVLDAGHGGNDHGTTSPEGVIEKDLVLDITMRLGKMLEERGTQVIYTRKEDRFVSLDARTEMANHQQADLFLSIHANSSHYRNVLGTETYYLNLTTVRADLDVAARENASSEKSLHELSDLLTKITRNEKLIESRDFAQRIQGATHELVTKTHGNRIYNRGVKKAPFVVLIGAKMPAVLVEIGFLTNPKEEAMMKKGDYRQRLAEALFKGVSQYAESLNRVKLARNSE